MKVKTDFGKAATHLEKAAMAKELPFLMFWSPLNVLGHRFELLDYVESVKESVHIQSQSDQFGIIRVLTRAKGRATASMSLSAAATRAQEPGKLPRTKNRFGFITGSESERCIRQFGLAAAPEEEARVPARVRRVLTRS